MSDKSIEIDNEVNKKDNPRRIDLRYIHNYSPNMKKREITDSEYVHRVSTNFHLHIKDNKVPDPEVKKKLEDIASSKNHFYQNGIYNFFDANRKEVSVKLKKDRFYYVRDNALVLDVHYEAEFLSDIDEEGIDGDANSYVAPPPDDNVNYNPFKLEARYASRRNTF